MIEKKDYFEIFNIIDEELLRSKLEFKDDSLFISSDHISLSDLSFVLKKDISDIISFFWNKGVKLTDNNSISTDDLVIYLSSIGVSLRKKENFSYNKVIDVFLKKETDIFLKENKLKNDFVRPPLVAIMGHVDHGKTTLFDTISNRSTQLREAGGITQRVSVFQVKSGDYCINFLDTPGHSDFIKMRKNGLCLSDFVILIINLEEGIKTQTLEIINYLKEYNLPFLIFANTKKNLDDNYKDKLIVNLNNSLQELDIIVSDFGGDKLLIVGSAKDKYIVDQLFETIKLFNFPKTSLSLSGNGIVIDSYWDYKRKAKIFEVLLMNGKLRKNEVIFLSGNLSKLKQITNVFDKEFDDYYPGDILKISGFSFDSELGDKFLMFNNIDQDDDHFFDKLNDKLISLNKKNIFFKNVENRNSFNVFLFSDSKNSLEALKGMIDKMNIKYNSSFVSVIGTSTNKITNSFLNLIKMRNSLVLLLYSKSDQEYSSLLKGENIPFFSSKVLYELENNLEKFISSNNNKKEYSNNHEEKNTKEVIGRAIVKKFFSSSKVGNIAGCRSSINGEICKKKNGKKVKVDLIREEKIIFSGYIESIEANKSKVDFVKGDNKEFGIVLEKFNNNYKENDELIFYTLK